MDLLEGALIAVNEYFNEHISFLRDLWLFEITDRLQSCASLYYIRE